MKAKITIIILSVLLVICVGAIAYLGFAYKSLLQKDTCEMSDISKELYKKSPHCHNSTSFDINDMSTWYDSTPDFFNLPTKEDVAKIEKGMLFEDAISIIGKPICHVTFSSSHDYAWLTQDGYVYFRLTIKREYDNGTEVEKLYISRQLYDRDSLMG